MELFSEKELLEIAEGIDSLTITIKAKENFIDILKRVSEEGEKGCQDVSPQMSDNEISKAIADCMDNPDCGKKEKKKKNKKFKVGDVVYWGEKKGDVIKQSNEDSEYSINVLFNGNIIEKDWVLSFTKDGRCLHGTPIVLSHFPYELKMKKIK